MKLIKKSFNPISLSKLIELHEQGITPKHAVAVTFDDGYSDFADYAFPILQEEGIPVTLFITTGFVNGDIWLWPDQIRYAVDNTKRKSFEFGEITGLHSPENRKSIIWDNLADHCLSLDNDRKLELIESIYKKLGLDRPRKAPREYSSVTWGQIKSMISYGLEIGSHSRTHPILTKIDEEELIRELVGSRLDIIKNLDIYDMAFCFPNGKEGDYNLRIQKKIESIGYKFAIAAFPSSRPLENRWAVNRYPAGNDFERFRKNVFGVGYLKSVASIKIS
ncbi:MAG: polysaccharide deacetylase family protein [Marinobacter sp.]